MFGLPGGFLPNMPAEGPGRRPAEATRLYELLGVDRRASQAEVKRAFQALAREHHPDKGGDAEKFKDIMHAYEVLGDPERRAMYDATGDEVAPGGQGSGRPGRPRPQPKSVVRPLKVSLEALYSGQTKKMRVTRHVIDREAGLQDCRQCSGRGSRLERTPFGQVLVTCDACGGVGRRAAMRQRRDEVEVHIPRGAQDGHRITLQGMADEQPGMGAGDVVFLLQEQEHPEFRRRGADLFVERRISLVEALCGFQLELTHLDGRRLLIRTSPGDIAKPMAPGFDPLGGEDARTRREVMEGCDCPGLDDVAQADGTDVDRLKHLCETELRERGIGVGAFVVSGSRAYFKECSREEALAAKEACRGSTMYVRADPDAERALRVMKAVKGEGMPTSRSPFVYGNLFLILTVEFPDSLSPEAQEALRALLPPPLHPPTFREDDPDVEVHTVSDADPVQSREANRINMAGSREAYDAEEPEGSFGQMHGGQPPQCQQM